jgi:uncharacterized membrane protein
MRTTQGLERFVTFVDAITAIAVTLLVLPLVDAASAAGHGTSLGELLRANSTHSFLLSFVVIARLWLAHHALFERVSAYDQVILLTSLCWALTIVVIPFPTQLIAAYGKDPGAMALYIGVLFVSCACLCVLSVHVSRTPSVQRPGLPPAAFSPAGAVSTTVWCAVAFALALASSTVNYYALLLLLLSGPTTRLWQRLVGSPRPPSA